MGNHQTKGGPVTGHPMTAATPPAPLMMQVGLELGRRTKIELFLCPNQARAAVSRSAAPASSGMRIHLTRGCRVPPRTSGGAGGCGARGGAAGHHACDTPVHRPGCWGLARESFARFRAALADPSQWRLRAWGGRCGGGRPLAQRIKSSDFITSFASVTL